VFADNQLQRSSTVCALSHSAPTTIHGPRKLAVPFNHIAGFESVNQMRAITRQSSRLTTLPTASIPWACPPTSLRRALCRGPCMLPSSESHSPQWRLCAGGGAVHNITCGHSPCSWDPTFAKPPASMMLLPAQLGSQMRLAPQAYRKIVPVYKGASTTRFHVRPPRCLTDQKSLLASFAASFAPSFQPSRYASKSESVGKLSQ